MKQEDKKILLQDLYSRLYYGFIAHRYSDNADIKINTIEDFSHFLEYSNNEKFKPYLRPMSSMTKKEQNKYDIYVEETVYRPGVLNCSILINFCNEHHLDYLGLIEKGLAIEAPEGMYKINE